MSWLTWSAIVHRALLVGHRERGTAAVAGTAMLHRMQAEAEPDLLDKRYKARVQPQLGYTAGFARRRGMLEQDYSLEMVREEDQVEKQGEMEALLLRSASKQDWQG